MSTARLSWHVSPSHKTKQVITFPPHCSPFSDGMWQCTVHFGEKLLSLQPSGCNRGCWMELSLHLPDSDEFTYWLQKQLAEQKTFAYQFFDSELPIDPSLACEKKPVVLLAQLHQREATIFPQILSGTLFGEIFNDVRIVFDGDNRSLSASSVVLKDKSSYFRSQLKAGFSESTGGETSAVKNVLLEARTEDPTYEDSDSKGDNKPGEAPSSTKKSQDEKYRIKLQCTLYRTMRAVLYWMYTGEINFTPLQSNAAITPEGMSLTYAPPSASPKSVYCLAHFLDIPELVAKSLKGLKNQINVDNVATELFGDVAATYSEIREMEMDFAIDNWDKVKESEALKGVEQMIEDDKLPGAAAVLIKLTKGLSSRRKETVVS